MKCPSCGNKVDSSKKFCSGCGNDLSVNPAIATNFIDKYSSDISFSGGVKAWIIICAVVQLISCILFLNDSEFYFSAIIIFLLSLSYLGLLIFRRKMFFYFIVLFVILEIIYEMMFLNSGLESMRFIMNPIITFACLYNYFGGMK